jgi:nickel-dependent lactate racemase
MMLFARGGPEDMLSHDDIKGALFDALGRLGDRKRVLAIPPDFTRFHSHAGEITELVWEFYQDTLSDVLPACGTHVPMTETEIDVMFGKVPKGLFRRHDWRKGLALLGEVPSRYVREVSEARVEYPIALQVNRLLAEGKHDLILSIGQVVPHEVIGMANHIKNVLVGTGGTDVINKTHFLGAAYGMERIMGRAESPVRRVLQYGAENFARHLPIVYVLTVAGTDANGKIVIRGLFIGDDVECFNRAAELSLKVNVELLEKPLKKVVVYLDPGEFKSTWLGNKSIYRTRMAVADGGQLIVLAPGLARFGEDAGIDALIRKYGYVGTPGLLDQVKRSEDLQLNLGAAAHLIHGSSEGRFSIVYCPGHLTKEEIDGVGLEYADLGEMMKRYNPERLVDGHNIMPGGEDVFFISHPALGLWSTRERFG